MPLKTHQDEPPSLNLTPMIDVVFLLIIFFMVGTKFTELERKIKLQVPEVGDVGTLTSAPERKVINVYHDGSITVDRRTVTELLTAARQEFQHLGVIIRGDADGPLQNVATVLGACQSAGVEEMGISVRIARNER
jgi:biopolymer transport protein ExbD